MNGKEQRKDKRVRFAIVGCGIIAAAHLKGIAEAEEAELAAVCDMSEERAKELAEEYGVSYYTDYDEMLARADIDVVCVCTPSSLHPEQTMKAAMAGKHVVCEKPLAIDMEALDKMLDTCQDQGVKLAAIFPRRMSAAARFVKSLIDEGRLGRLSLCSGHIKFYRDQAYYDSAGWRGTWSMDGGGAMMNQGIHTIDLLQWLAGPVERLTGYARPVLRNIEVEDTAVVSLQFSSGALGVIEATTTAYEQPSHRICLHGEKGTVILTGDEISSLDLIDESVEIPVIKDEYLGHVIQIRDMAQAVLEDREPAITGMDARHSLEIIMGTYVSSRSREEYRLKAVAVSQL